MRKINVNQVLLGMRLSRPVFTNEGRILLTSGMELNNIYMERLIENGIEELYIEDEISKGIIVVDVVHEHTRQEAKSIIKTMMTDYNFSSLINVDQVGEIVIKMIEELLENDDILVNLADIRSVDDYTFEHSVNVCIFSLISGIGLGYNVPRLKDLGMGALLHDIGKLRIPEQILKKPSRLSVDEFDEIKRHTIYGYEILKNCPSVSMVSAFIAIGHHERYDGSGYPLQLKGESIHQCARIVAVADVYDALTSNRVYRKKLKSHEVVEYMILTGSQHFDKEILDTFLKYVALYPIGSGVVLNTNERAIVVKTNAESPIKPVVRIVFDKFDRKLKEPTELDLEQFIGVFIVDSCDI